MKLRTRIADALRHVARETTEKARVAAAVAVVTRDAAMSGRAVRAAAAATVFVDIARWLDPQPHAEAGPAADLDPNRGRVEPASPAGARAVDVEQPSRAASADTQSLGWTSHDVDGSTVSVGADMHGQPVIGVHRADRLRVGKGGRA